MAELKPCPFCGGEASIIRTYTDDRQYQVFCGCGGRVAYFDTEEEAIEAWNKRVEIDSFKLVEIDHVGRKEE